ncbi:GNAT family N-acetyltransferase [Cellulomonas endometrii]|uniref:GNAT family N-acetyltransferase n=1 Tax=Cellulomonas endometrii TaxID=3036301 RepID=UPI0024AD23F3|nr:GNAT family N-acetyltransferase [Cellulomonas endometrii]
MPLFAPDQPHAHGRPDPTVRVRAARPSDVAGIVAVAATRGRPSDDVEDRVAGWVRDHGRLVLVAEREEEVAGWAMLAAWAGFDDAPDGRYVSALTVDPGSRRRGIGSTLLAELRASTGDDVHSVVNARNRPSLALHARHGFRELRRGRTFAGVDFDGGTGVLLRAPGAEEGT